MTYTYSIDAEFEVELDMEKPIQTGESVDESGYFELMLRELLERELTHGPRDKIIHVSATVEETDD